MKEYEYLWRNKFLTMKAKTIDDMIEILSGAVEELKEMKESGVTLGYGAEDDYATLITTDPKVAEKFGFYECEDCEEEDDDEELQ